MKALPILALLLAALLFSPATATAQSPLAAVESEQQALFDSIAPSVVFVLSPRGFGSGFYVADDLVLTNAHVVGKATDLKIVVRGGKRHNAKVIDQDAEADLALLRVDVPGTPLPLTPTASVRVGSWVGAVGHGEGGVWSFTTGMVSNVYVRPGVVTLIQTQIPINFGNSGGPIFTRTSEVVAVATAKNSRAENLNFAVPVDVAVERFPALRAACECLRVKTAPKARVFVDGRLVGTGPEVVVTVSRGIHDVLVIDGKDSRQTKVDFPRQSKLDLR